MIDFNIELDNEFSTWEIDKENILNSTKKLLEYYISSPEIYNNSCLEDLEYNRLSFDIVLTDSKNTHQINKEYRNKDYPADIITFSLFADSSQEERFIIDFEINLGEIIIGLDKVIDSANQKGVEKETELIFLISHGILHLLGFDHQTMEDFNFVIKHQKLALESMGIVYDKI